MNECVRSVQQCKQEVVKLTLLRERLSKRIPFYAYTVAAMSAEIRVIEHQLTDANKFYELFANVQETTVLGKLYAAMRARAWLVDEEAKAPSYCWAELEATGEQANDPA